MESEPRITAGPGDDRLRRWFAPLLAEGATWCAPNLDTRIAFLRTRSFEVPLTINEGEWDNSWICSPWTHYVSYADEEIGRATGPLLAGLSRVLFSRLGKWFRHAGLNRVVMVNNWLLSTNPWPRWDAEDLDEVVGALVARWPDRTIIFRALNERESGPLLQALAKRGARIIPSRQVWWYEPGSAAVAESFEFRKDEKLLRRPDLGIVPHEAIGEGDYATLTKLYDSLYIGKYSRHNPRFTEDWFRHLHREGLAHFTALREPGGAILGVEACVELHGVLTSPIVGYDLDQPRSLGLYRRLAAIPVLEARRRGLPLNLSAGVGRFKALRGGEPVMEYLAVIDRHLPAFRRRPWACIEALSKHLLAPYVRRHGL